MTLTPEERGALISCWAETADHDPQNCVFSVDHLVDVVLPALKERATGAVRDAVNEGTLYVDSIDRATAVEGAPYMLFVGLTFSGKDAWYRMRRIR